jgi:cytochrome c2
MTLSFLRQLFGLRVRHHDLSFPLYVVWFVVSGLVLITLPTYLRLDVAFWELPTPQLLPFYVLSVAYLLLSFILFFGSGRAKGLNIYLAVAIGALCFLLPAGFLNFIEDLEFSRLVLIGSIVLGIALAIYPLLLSRRGLLLSAVLLLALLVGVAVSIFLRPDAVKEQDSNVARIISSRYVLDKTTYQVIPSKPDVEGGAITEYGEGFIAVTGDGEFFRLGLSAQGDAPDVVRMSLGSPLVGRDTFYENKGKAQQFRVTDLLIQTTPGGDFLLAAHQIWDQASDCFLMGVSRAPLSGPGDSGAGQPVPWERIYETQPCIEQPFDTVETGGRLAWAAGTLLLTVGDHGKDGRRTAALAQDPVADYGKVLALDMHGGAEVLTSGHRNPQGLLVDQSGQVWVTEHGPAGGDELNLLVAGRNYGWPLVTYGTEYSKRTWPLNPDGRDHGGFTEPVHAFVPAVAISNLIQVGGEQFPRWEGDLLIGSLRKESLYRVRVRENRVIYVESIFLGKRVRDLVEAPDGRILVWSDDESLTVLSRRPDPDSGEETFDQCRSCHEPVGKAKAVAPSLKRIVGRNIAARRGFNYSPGLKAVEGVWTEERLLEFLENPPQFAPGTTMGSNGVPDDTDRAALVQFLKSYGVTGQ